MLGLSIAMNLLVDGGDMTDELRLLDPLCLPLELAPRLFGDRGEEYEQIATLPVVLGVRGWLVGRRRRRRVRYRRLAAV